MSKFKKFRTSKKALSLLFASGIFLIVVSVGILVAGKIMVDKNPSTAKAAQPPADENSWNYDYTVSKWRYLQVRYGSVDQGYLSLGPAEWTVDGYMGSKHFTETWSVPISPNNFWTEGRSTCEDKSGTDHVTCTQSSYSFDNAGSGTPQFFENDFYETKYFGIGFTSGLYGAIVRWKDENTGKPGPMRASYYSIPKLWSVSGSFN